MISLMLFTAAVIALLGAVMLPFYAYGVDTTQPVDLVGTVVDDNSDELEGVRITVRNTTLETYTHQDGKFYFKGFPSGEFEIIAEKEGYATVNKSVLVANGFFEKVSIEMEGGAGFTSQSADYATWDDFYLSLYATSIIGMLFAPFIFLGSRYAEQKTRFSVVLVGSLVCLFMLPIFMSLIWWATAVGVIVSLLGMISLVMTVTDRNSFVPSYPETECEGGEA